MKKTKPSKPIKKPTHTDWNYIDLPAPEIKTISNRRALRDKGLLCLVGKTVSRKQVMLVKGYVWMTAHPVQGLI